MIIWIIGLSGSGKTTIADLLCGVLVPREGEILVDGIDLKDLNILVNMSDEELIKITKKENSFKNNKLLKLLIDFK